METRWRDTVIVDYEIGLPDHAVVEWELYSQGLLRVPTVLLGEPWLFGRQRRPGIVDIPEADYDAVSTRIARLMLDLDGVGRLAGRTEQLYSMVGDQLTSAEHQPGAGLAGDLVERVCQLMTLHVVNWMWPVDEFERIASAVLGDEDAGHRAVLSLLVPTAPAHMLDFHQHVLAAVEQTLIDPGRARVVADRLASDVGFAQRPAMPRLAPQPWEHADTVGDVLAGWSTAMDTASVVEQRQALRAAHGKAQAERRAIYAALLAASSGDPARWRQVQAIATACRLAADAEERRKMLQLRFLRLARILSARSGLPPATSTLADLAAATLMATREPGC
ncbi:MAG: hypothetical protein ACRDS1_00370 [Pseudonocardiaceae bacterium]